MKRVLAILASFSLSTSASLSVIACGYFASSNPDGSGRDIIGDLSKTFLLEDDENSSSITDDKLKSWISDNDINGEITNFIKKNIATNADKISLETDFNIFIDQSQGIKNEGYKRAEDSQGKQLLIGSKVTVVSTETSEFLVGSFDIYFQKSFNYLRDFINQEQRTKEMGQELQIKFSEEINKWAPDAVAGVDYFFKDLVGERDGSWVLEFSDASNFVYGQEIVFSVNYETPIKDPVDISGLKLVYEFDQVTNSTVEQEVNQAIEQLLTDDDTVELGVDYTISAIDYDEQGRPLKPTVVVVSAIEAKKTLTGSFKVYLKKTLDLSKYPNKGTKEDGQQIRQEIEDEIKSWLPEASDGNGYTIKNEDKSWSITADEDFELIFDFEYLEVASISNLEIVVFVDDLSVAEMKTAVVDKVNAMLITEMVSENDFVMPEISVDENGYATQVGLFSVQASQDSNLITGSFNLHLRKRITRINGIGTTNEWNAFWNDLLLEINRWDPSVVEGVDYTKFRDGNTWKVFSLETAVNKNLQIENIQFTLNNDISNLGKLFNISVDDQIAEKKQLEAAIENEIRKIDAEAKMGVDYVIDQIPYNRFDKPSKLGRYQVHAVEDTNRLTGSFEIRFYKILDYTHREGFNGSNPVLPYEWSNMQQEIIAEIHGWDPDAVEEVDFEFVEREDYLTVVPKNNYDNIIFIGLKVHVIGDLGILKLAIEITDDLTMSGIEQQVHDLVSTIDPRAVLGVDYVIEQISDIVDGKPSQVTTFEVQAVGSSKILAGEFSVTLVKTLDFSDFEKYPNKGKDEDWLKAKQNILLEILKWNRQAQNQVDYILDEVNYTISPVATSKIKFNEFKFNLTDSLETLDQLVLDFNEFHINDKNKIKRALEDYIRNELQLNVVYGVDFEMVELETLQSWKAKVFNPYRPLPGIYHVVSLNTSTLLTGSFTVQILGKLSFEKDASISATEGWGTISDPTLRATIAALKDIWLFSEGKEYIFTDFGAWNWEVKSIPESNFEFYFFFTSFVFDIGELGLDFEMSLDNFTENNLWSQVQIIFRRINLEKGLNLERTVDYGVDPVNVVNGVYQAGNYHISTLLNQGRDSYYIKGFFTAKLWKELHQKDYLSQGSKEEGFATLEKVIADIQTYYRRAVSGVDYEIKFNDDDSWTIKSIGNQFVKLDLKFDIF